MTQAWYWHRGETVKKGVVGTDHVGCCLMSCRTGRRSHTPRGFSCCAPIGSTAAELPRAADKSAAELPRAADKSAAGFPSWAADKSAAGLSSWAAETAD